MTDLTQTRRPRFLGRHKCAALVATTLIAITVGTIGFVDSGIYNVSASYPDDPLVAWALHDVYIHSLHQHAKSVVVPADIMSADNIQAGARLYDSTCAYCHGAPGRPLSSIGQGILPLAPPLLDAHRRNNPMMMFWVMKNGVRMTAMPSFGKTQSDQTLWQLAAFLQKEHGISAQDYSALVANGAGVQDRTPQGAPSIK
jgi:mono/diheme cytochrome c family protein